ncbi:MAG: ABC transporter ATP-binding protein [Actinobacteria bacterium]|nr:ABC transporter ATP-binding protein [Actinomycetota bacterium]
MRSHIVEGHGLGRHYEGGVRALDGLDFSVACGEWLAIMGPSGSGKSTLLNLLGCLDTPSEGHLTIGGVEVTGLRGRELTRFRREVIGLVFQQFHLVPYLSALENVMLAQYFHSLADQDEARMALEHVGLAERLQHLPSQLSGGEQQRVCIARALINDPRLVLADEPTGNLDKANESIVLDLFRKLHAEGRTLVVVTHDPEVAALADRVITLDHGRADDDRRVLSERSASSSIQTRDHLAPAPV